MVAAEETTLQALLEGTKQYQVPLYQRTYSWSTAQLARLWDDIAKLAEDRVDTPGATHFVGSLVLAPSPSIGPTGVQRFLVVDGQQRMTTLSLLLCAVRDHRATTEDSEHRDRINELYLQNKWKPENQKLKFVPTQADRPAYEACLYSTPQAGGTDPVGAAYRYFRTQLEQADDPDDPFDIERIEDAVISGLALVAVTAQHGDNVHRIFESLNNTGLRLTQGDLLRNYLFMRMPTRAENVYHTLWLPLQDMFTAEQLEQLFWIDLVHDDPKTKQTDVYARHQVRLDRLADEAQIEDEVRRLGVLGSLYKTILDPTRESDADVRHRLVRLAEWGSTTVHPLTLHLLHLRERKEATSEQVAAALLIVESFLVRRLITGWATGNLNRILLSAPQEMDRRLPVDQAVHRFLSIGRKHFATNRQLAEAIGSRPFYLSGRAGQRFLVLAWLEESYASKEPVGLKNLTIEHVLPQKLTAAGEKELALDLADGEDVGLVHESLVHTLGNLTLTGYNQSLSNSPFGIKREKLAASGLAMNKEIAAQDRWGRTEILDRGRRLAERIATIWPGPLDVADDDAGIRWDLVNRALRELPAGSWTSYGDLAALIGSHPVPVGMRLATKPIPNAHRVLQVDGRVSPGFKWLDPTRTDDPRDLLVAEGVVFDEQGRAEQEQRAGLEKLATLCGLTEPGAVGELRDLPPGPEADRRDKFLTQLGDVQEPNTVHGVIAILNGWTAIGGIVEYGSSAETSAFALTECPLRPGESIWPMVIYPSGRVEVVFQYLATRPPFDDVELREELRMRLNQMDGVEIPPGKLELRPGFDLDVLATESNRETLAATLVWFFDQVHGRQEITE
ncbi:GmrSD restriction endonuclease domain-containing protein [Nakamurella sp.]|uniref:GmrSD restriction endonuclease domain-containing protein n=1 Tax=Nakamurella sp. TaxID=1869182 RepID=UPI003B3BA5C2